MYVNCKRGQTEEIYKKIDRTILAMVFLCVCVLFMLGRSFHNFCHTNKIIHGNSFGARIKAFVIHAPDRFAKLGYVIIGPIGHVFYSYPIGRFIDSVAMNGFYSHSPNNVDALQQKSVTHTYIVCL